MKNTAPKRFLKLFFLLSLILSLAFSLSLTSQAASTKVKALKAYKKMLSKTTIDRDGWPLKAKNCSFAIAYIDNNNVPELILYNNVDIPHAGGYATLYTYRNGKVKFVDAIDDSAVGYYKKKGIYVSSYYQGGESISYIKLNKGTSKWLLSKSYYLIGLEKSPYEYSKAASSGSYTKITKKQFTSQLKKYVGSKKMSKFKFYKNTAKNRKKHIY